MSAFAFAVAAWAAIANAFGFLLGHWIANRWIDHRWYCGHRHPANHPCAPTPESLERWRKIEERANRAEELEDEAKHLRRWP